MAAFGGIGFCCCDGPCPCAVSDDFAADSIADYDVTGTFAVAGGVLTASTAGTATQDLKLPTGTRAAGVKADVANNSHALFGLVIGSGDNRIEWLWDVAGTQCTLVVYSEGVAIVDVDYAGAPATSLEVQITFADCAWDVAVYRDDVLVATHLAVAVTFDADWTAFGVTANDASGGTWDNLCLRACGSVCEIVTCEVPDANPPMAWRVSAGSITSTGSPVATCDDACVMLGGDWVCVSTDSNKHGPLIDGLACVDMVCTTGDGGPIGACIWYSLVLYSETTMRHVCDVTGDGYVFGGVTCDQFPRDGGSVILGPVKTVWLNDCIENSSLVGCMYCQFGQAWIVETVALSSTTFKIRATAHYEGIITGAPSTGGSVTAVYESATITTPTDLMAAGAITLDYVSDTSAGDTATYTECNWPATVDVEAITDEGELAVLLNCESNRCVNLFSTHGLLSLDGSIGGVTGEFRVCLSGPAGLSNGPFTGTINGAAQGMTGDCATATIDVTLECRRVCEHQYAWVLVLDDGTNVAEIVYEPAAAPNVGDVVSGTVTLCGGTQAFAALLSDFAPSEEDHPFTCACPDANVALLCGSFEAIRAEGQVIPDTGTCVKSTEFWGLTTGAILCFGTPITPTGFDSSKNYFRGTFPIDDGAGIGSFEVLLYCASGTLRYAVLDADDCVIDEGVVTSWDCETMSGYIEAGVNLDGCQVGGGTARINLG